MTTRDPRSRDYPGSGSADSGRELTESLHIEPELEAAAPADLAVGTHDPQHQPTSVESPRGKIQGPPAATPQPPRRRPGAPAPEDRLGQVLGSYRLLEVLGKGGMGHVYRAEHTRLGRVVALKLLRSDYASRRDAVSRFFHEARTVNRVRHRNIIDVTDLVELDDGTTYIIMELLRGQSLGAWARSGVDSARTLTVLVQICDGLGAAHQVGVVHRDLKPDNVIVVPEPGGELAKVLDFGVAKLVSRDDEDVGFETAAGAVIGTPAYMSPEQAGGMAVDGRSDIYSLGAIMYELFCHQPVFRGRSFGEYVRKHLTEMPVPPHQTARGADLDPRIEAVILRCLDKDPDQRFNSTSELREALRAIAATPATQPRPQDAPPTGAVVLSPLAPLVPLVPLAPLAPLAPPPGVAAPSPPTSPGRRRLSVIAACAAAVVAIASAWALWTAKRQPASAERAASPRVTAPSAPSAESRTVSPANAAGARAAGAPAPAARPAPAAGLPAVIEPAPHVQVHITSQPSGEVFTEAGAGSLCRTPCDVEVNLGDGGPRDRRTFVVKRSGYADEPLTIDFTGEQRDFRVTLQRTKPAHRPGRDRSPTGAPGASAAATAAKVTPASAPAANVPPADAPSARPAIEPTDTLDPFRPKP